MSCSSWVSYLVSKHQVKLSCVPLNGWNPELVFPTVVFFNSTDLAVVIPNSTVKRCLFYSTTL